MKYCSECGAVIGDDRVCPECGKRYRKKDTPASIAVMIISFIFLACVCFYVFGGSFFGEDESLITMSEFEKIQTGMTYRQVCELIGSQGELNADGGSFGGDAKITMYIWDGASLGSSAMITFINGRVESKVQSGL